MICLGSCIDHQGAARAEKFDEHPDRELFEKLAASTRKTIQQLRRMCLRHQVEIIDDQLARGEDDAEALSELRLQVIHELGRDPG